MSTDRETPPDLTKGQRMLMLEEIEKVKKVDTILEKQEELGMSSQVQRRYMLRPRTLAEMKKTLEQDLRRDHDGSSEIAFLKKILLILIDELLTLKGV